MQIYSTYTEKKTVKGCGGVLNQAHMAEARANTGLRAHEAVCALVCVCMCGPETDR